jgi:N-acetylmuramoyl-L-alanine amidase
MNADSYTIVIDAGHGGKDVGALGQKVREKDVNLSVALRLGEMISNNMENVKVVFTRDDDKYLTLQERAQIANKAKGDLFISIHCNSLDKRNKDRKTIKGASTYTLGLHKSDDNLEVAMRENSVIALEENYEKKYHGFDPASSESYIIFEINQSSHMQQSVDFASRVQKKLSSTAKRADRGVRQAGFLVLAQTSMPAVLVELDFICNPTQEKFLGSKSGQKQMADAIYNAFVEYKDINDKKVAAVNTKGNSIQQDIDEANDVSIIRNNNKIEYKIQFLTSTKKLDVDDSKFKGLETVDVYKEDKIYKYIYGSFDSETAAKKELKNVRKKFPEAFIVVFENGKRIK